MEVDRHALAHHPNAKCYIDDVLIYSTVFEQHLARFRQAFDSIAAMGLKSHPTKCVLDAQEVPCLGHLLSARGVRHMEAKVKTIVETPATVDVSPACGPLQTVLIHMHFSHLVSSSHAAYYYGSILCLR